MFSITEQKRQKLITQTTQAWSVPGVTDFVPSSDQAVVGAALGHPLNALLMLSFITAMFYHAYLGLQVVIEDYVHPRALEITLMVLIRFGAVLAVLSATIAILRLVFTAAPLT